MERGWDRGGWLRARGEGQQPVTPLELFFDLVFVFAITQISHHLLEHPTVAGALETLVLLLAVWWAWVYTSWVTNYLDPNTLTMRLLLVCVMLASLVMSAAIPESFGERGLAFALAYVAIQVGRTAFAAVLLGRSLGRSHPLHRSFQRGTIWLALSAVPWIAGGLAEDEARYALWLLALAMEYGSSSFGFYLPGLGRSRTADWTVEGGHFAERCYLFVILSLGESIILTGATFADLEASRATTAAFFVAFLGSVALWWIYFDRGQEEGHEALASSEDPGRLALSAYTYFHLPMVAGIIAVAASDEETIAHPADPGTLSTVALTLGGAALFVAGHALFRCAVSGRAPWSRLVAVLVLAALAPAGFVLSQLALAVAATLVLVALAAWDSLTVRRSAKKAR